MSKLEELIEELCPDGVEYRELRELGNFFGGITGKSKDDFSNGNAKFITYKNIYYNPALNIDISDTVLIKDGEKQHTVDYGDVLFTGSSETSDECGISSVLTVKTDEKLYLNSFCFIFRFNDGEIMLPDFAKHLFRSKELRCQIGKTANGVTRFNISKKLMAYVTIPIPPLEIQREIVRILDNFTELTARKKQYEYYRDTLLSFGDGVEWKAVGEIFNIKNGYTPSKVNAEFWENGTIPWFRMEDIRANGRILSDSIQHITESAIKGKLFPANSIIISTSATIGEHALITEKFLANQRFTVINLKDTYENRYNIKFIFYYSFLLDEWCKDNTTVSNFASIDMGAFKNLKIPIPPLAEQQRIVDILDRFDTLCNDISQGIPAEIKARQKQYEYYRDKLLNFKKINTEV